MRLWIIVPAPDRSNGLPWLWSFPARLWPFSPPERAVAGHAKGYVTRVAAEVHFTKESFHD